MSAVPNSYEHCVIKSFKHDGSLHRVWVENWRIPDEQLHPIHANESMWVYLNDHTTIIEKGGKEWISKIPAVSFFMPQEWFNVVALLESKGIRYYCNLASPPYRYGNTLTYIDYDLDLVSLPDGSVHELDREEYGRHREEYRYSEEVQVQVEQGLIKLREKITAGAPPFTDTIIYNYYEQWKNQLDV
ncbi:MAG: DUF402 domain-containing protein [Candidatus Cohnella colombiensis]|uniref:DUF402 domain-containing protein n=1 Tax=Candidatus Cohnella colombiensis TaxID=3121368 RepID=A0AA95EVE3_9BACL|nr:MAG: DUF402 domain-containing protein [Cohnella sp.]